MIEHVSGIMSHIWSVLSRNECYHFGLLLRYQFRSLTLVVDIEILQMYSSESESIPDVFTVEAIYGGARVVFINCG